MPENVKLKCLENLSLSDEAKFRLKLRLTPVFSYDKLQKFAMENSGWENIRGALFVPRDQSKFDPTLILIWIIAVSCVTIGSLLSSYQSLQGTIANERSGLKLMFPFVSESRLVDILI